MSEPSELPWLVVHGAVFWKVLLVIATAAVFFGWIGVGTWRRRRAARMWARGFARRVAAPNEGAVVLEGVLRGGGVRTLHDETHRAASDRDRELWLECHGERVQLEGPIELAHGTRCVASGWTPPSTLTEGLREQAGSWRGPMRFVEVGDGERVFVEGTARRTAARGETGLRDSAGAWALTPTVATLAMCAATPSIPRVRVAVAPSVFGIVAIAIAIYAGMNKVGSWAGDLGTERKPLDVAQLDRLAIAAAMPGSRENALSEIEVLANLYGSNVTPRIGGAIARLRHGCPGEAEFLVEHDRFEDGLALAQRCDASSAASDALVYLGRFDEASSRLDPMRSTSYAFIAAGKWRESALAAASAADQARPIQTVEGRAEVARNSCLAELFRSWAGDRDAATRLLSLAKTSVDAVCAIAAGEVVGVSERAATIARLWPSNGYYRYAQLAQVVALAAGQGDAKELDYALPRNETAPLVWLAPWIVETWAASTDAADQPAQALAWRWRARMHVVLGDLGAARADLERLAKVDSGFEVDATVDLVALHGSDLVVVPRHDWRYNALRWRTERHPEVDADGLEGPALAPALEQAARGDGRSLAGALEKYPYLWIYRHHVLAVLPRVTIGRDELARTLARLFDRDAKREWRGPFAWVEHAALRRDFARMIGDRTQQARWQGIVDRHRAAFADRRRLIGVMLWRDWI